MNGQKRGRRERFPNNIRRRQSGIVLVMGDGESEKAYFERLSDLCESVGIKAYATAKTGPDILIRKTSEYVRKHDLDPSDGDFVAIVMDLDGRFSESQIADMDAKCNRLGFHLFLSNPSFEVWLLSHFRQLTHPYTQDELIDDMGRALGGGYSKSRGFEIDDGMVDGAIENSRKLLPDEECNPVGSFRHNPSTMVHSLVDTIRKRVRR